MVLLRERRPSLPLKGPSADEVEVGSLLLVGDWGA